MKISQPDALSQNAILKPLQAWSRWMRELSFLQKMIPAAAIGLYWLTLLLLNGLRGDHFFWGGMILFLSYVGPMGRTLLRFALPFFLTLIIYDSQRFYSDAIRGRIHISEPYNFDLRFFGISTAQGVLTPNEWCQLHTHPVLDLIAGFAYLVFFSVFILISAYFVFYLSSRGTEKMTPQVLTQKAARMPWAFFWLNMLGYTTYYWYAAAPPWYVASYGLGPANLAVQASSAGCARFDQLLGTHFFSEMYGRAADVFGAIPSLHIAYPLLGAFFAFRFGSLRIFCFCFYLLMCFSAVYLNHHYILDILWGSTYALLVGWIVYSFPIRRSL
ncbi:MAG: phosphatase PAP2 family protein, partial [Bdellovibrionia bacterium]